MVEMAMSFLSLHESMKVSFEEKEVMIILNQVLGNYNFKHFDNVHSVFSQTNDVPNHGMKTHGLCD